ncbi:MAG: phosphocholine cytidylyltransferase family protein [Deferribacteres bacterium]|nr:phosphocholine cytidylyltransferase family protein [Deferribacteres bacterium]
MKALLLAAGQGRRLLPYTEEVPKALLAVDEEEGLTIIEYQVKRLKELGVEDIVVVVGYKGGRIKEVLKESVVYVENRDYERTNSIYSVFLALPFLDGDVVVMNSDVLFHKRILEALLSSSKDAVITVDSGSVLDEEAMKVVVEGERVVEVGKNIDPARAYGENVGIVRFSGEAFDVMACCVKKLVGEGCVKEWFPKAFNEFVKERPLSYIDIAGLPWIEIDFPGDLLKARREVFPLVK